MLAPLVALALAASPAPAQRPKTTPLFVAYNVLYQGGDDAKTVAAIAQLDADVVCLTELTPRFARAFDAVLAPKYPHRAFHPRDGTWGVGIASKHPVVAQRSFPQAPHRMPAVEADVRVDGVLVRVACVHLFPPGAKQDKKDDLPTTMAKNDALRVQQAQGLVKRYANVTGPLVVLGDYNEGRDGDAIGVLTGAGRLAHACDTERARCGATWPGPSSPWPAVVEIDHILARGGQLSDARVVRAGGSDHFPVAARFAPAP